MTQTEDKEIILASFLLILCNDNDVYMTEACTDIISTTGKSPRDFGGYCVATSDGVWIGGGTETPIELSDVEDDISFTTEFKLRRYGYLVVTSDGIWIGSGNATPEKLPGVTGDVLAVTGGEQTI